MRSVLLLMLALLFWSCNTSKKMSSVETETDSMQMHLASETQQKRSIDAQEHLKFEENQDWNFEIVPMDSTLSFLLGDMEVKGNVQVKAAAKTKKQKERVRTIYVKDTITKTDTIVQTQTKYKTKFVEAETKKTVNRWFILPLFVVGFICGILIIKT